MTTEDVCEVPDRAADMMLPEKPKGAAMVHLKSSPVGKERNKKMFAALMN